MTDYSADIKEVLHDNYSRGKTGTADRKEQRTGPGGLPVLDVQGRCFR